MQPVIQDHRLAGWRYNATPGSPFEAQIFLPEEIWHDKLPNPFDPYRGLAPLDVAAMATRTDFAAASHMRAILESNADTGLIIRADNQLSDEQREQIVAALKDRRWRRAASPNTCTFLWGATEVIQPTLSSADLQLLDNRKFSRAEICAAFGIPEEIITTSDHNKYDVMRGARLNFIENRIAPLCARLEAAEQQTVRALDPSATGWFDLDSLPIMQDARRQRLASARAAFEMGIPLNELNRLLDLGIKPFPWGDTPYVPSSLQPVSNSSL
jgi:phage portal protein BeeE